MKKQSRLIQNLKATTSIMVDLLVWAGFFALTWSALMLGAMW